MLQLLLEILQDISFLKWMITNVKMSSHPFSPNSFVLDVSISRRDGRLPQVLLIIESTGSDSYRGLMLDRITNLLMFWETESGAWCTRCWSASSTARASGGAYHSRLAWTGCRDRPRRPTRNLWARPWDGIEISLENLTKLELRNFLESVGKEVKHLRTAYYEFWKSQH